jgi:hypothetical protein
VRKTRANREEWVERKRRRKKEEDEDEDEDEEKRVISREQRLGFFVVFVSSILIRP